MVLVRSFMSEISPILCLSACSDYTGGSKEGVLPVYESLSSKDHGEELTGILCLSVSILQLPKLSMVPYRIRSAVQRPPFHTCRSSRAADRR